VDPAGVKSTPPIALCEIQGYVYDAKRRMADVFEALGADERASALRHQAEQLRQQFEAAFWLEEEGTYCFGLDAHKQSIRTVVSNAGHCLWSGIARPDRAARVVQRLIQADMSSGWGIRTLSAGHRCYNPHSYHRGSIWPHDNGIIAAGFRPHGLSPQGAATA